MNGQLPVNIYQEGELLMVAAPMPGMEAQDIEITLEGSRLAIRAGLRGPGQQRSKSFVLQEWTSGPYERTIQLPKQVDGSRANATYDNGILVLMFPLNAQAVSAHLHMIKVGTAKGQLVGQRGHQPRPQD